MKFIRPLAALLLVSLLGACAHSPQQIELRPQITLADDHPSTLSSVSVTVYDERLNKVIGTRGGVYAETSSLTLAPDFAQKIQQAVEQSLGNMGLEIDDQAPRMHFNLYLDALNYQLPDGNLSTKLDLSTRMRAEVIRDARTFQGSYQSQSSHRIIKKPSDDTNQQLLNALINDALKRMFDDRQLLKFISQR